MKKIALILSLLNKREKRQLVFVVFALLVMGIVELIGVGSISPFISVVSNPEVIHTNKYLNAAYEYFQFSSDNAFIIAFGITIIVILALSNLCLSGVSFLIYFYSGKRYHSISMRLFERYLRQPYVFYLNVNTSDLTKTLLGDVNIYVNRIFVVFLQLISSSIISLLIIILLIIVNPLVALIISAAFIMVYVVIFSGVKNFLARKGIEKNAQTLLKFKYVNETFGGIKDIKILGKEKIFYDLFAVPSKKYALAEAVSDIINEVPKYLLETIAFSCILGIIIFLLI
jgi:ABC-type multidrug transport system fused ATPase/permease subunit